MVHEAVKYEDWQWVILFTPLVTCMVSSYMCSCMKRAGKKLKQRPPSWVFGVVWPILYLLLGAAWNFTINTINTNGTKLEDDLTITMWVFYSLLVLFLALWPWVFNRSPRMAMFMLLVILVLTLVCWSISPVFGRVCLSPLVGWLIFALMLNYHVI